ncbi:Phosphotransferase [Pleurostoma richardsiae]|uniref:Phosphotransferase n=1 Tax=Pleurostoma richardsiae TaxID=41990 RepID=A0AA38VG52_9PEZI|nr:Phosphotransferase [Pleurostoma richardsiae]
MSDDRADFDNVAWDRNDEAFETSQRFFRLVSTLRKLESFVTRKFGRVASWVSPMRIGGYNNLYRMRLEGSNDDVMIRLPQPNKSQFPYEKTLREAATANFIAQNTRIPVPRVLFYGSSSMDSELGPYTIIPYVENRRSLSHALAMPNEDATQAHMLDPDISEEVLEDFYGKVAVYLLQLFKLSFPRIGSLAQTGENTFSVVGRPITQNMNSMLQLANIPHVTLPPKDRTYRTADEWYLALAEMHIAQLVFQHNDLVATADDCRNKYVARQLFRRLAKQGRLSSFGFAEDDWSAQSKSQTSMLCPAPSSTTSFRLWCDDFRAGNILLDETDEIAAFIDWEFTYIAPTQFALDPPWWLLLNAPEAWYSRIDDWTRTYSVRLETWLRAMESVEKGNGVDGFTVSAYMRESWVTGRFWLNYAARKSWAFDTIFWKYLDERFFGGRVGEIAEQDLWKTRIHMLTDRERSAMEPFVERKMEESKERILIDWNDGQVKERLDDILFDD